MIPQVRREGKLVWKTPKKEWNKALARNLLLKKYSDKIKAEKLKIKFGSIRRDGTRSVALWNKDGRYVASWTYLTDIKR
jgi:hypothetical protein